MGGLLMARTPNPASVGTTAGDCMEFADEMILSAPTVAEAERRLRAVIEHCETRLGHVAWYRDRKQSSEDKPL